MIKKIAFYVIYFASPIILASVVYFSNPVYLSTSRFIPMVLGVTAFTLLNAQLVLSARPKLIERSFGLDKLYRFHGIMALVAILLAGMHQELEQNILPESLQTNIGNAAFALFVICSLFALVLMADTLVQKFKLVKKVRVYFKNNKFGQYDVQVVLHNLNVLAVLILFVHVMSSSSAQNLSVRTLYILYFSVAMGFYLYHKVIRPQFFTRHFKVKGLIQESSSITTIELNPINGKNFSYKPGQFGFIKLKDSAISGEEHPFSFSSQPGNRKAVSMTIKRLGDWTEKVSEIKTGSVALVDGPYGKFSPMYYDCREGIVLIAGGVGITPMLSIIRYFEEQNRNQKMLLFWAVKSSEDLICVSEFKKIIKDMKNFTFVPVASSDPNFKGETGHINKEIIQKYIRGRGYDAGKLQYFFCGPGPMWPTIEEILLSMGIKKSLIHRENFSL